MTTVCQRYLWTRKREMAVLRQATALASGAAASYVAYQLSRGDEGRRSLLLGLARADASVRPVLAAVLPHDAFVCLYSASRTPFLHALGSCSAGDGGHLAGSSPVRVMGLSFRNDLGNAAGLDKDATLLDLNYGLGAGFAVVGTVLSEEHTGNVENMLGGAWSGNAWTPLPASGGALNSLGLPSKGVDTPPSNPRTQPRNLRRAACPSPESEHHPQEST